VPFSFFFLIYQGKRRAESDDDTMAKDRKLARDALIESRICEFLSNFTNSSSLSPSFRYDLFQQNTTSQQYWAASLTIHYNLWEQQQVLQNMSSNDQRFHHNLNVIKFRCMQGSNDDANVGPRHGCAVSELYV
jgi:hypothetical protein